jgi:glucose/mannose transport system substrate-binding protein
MRKWMWLAAAFGVLTAGAARAAENLPQVWHYYAAGSEKAGIDAMIEYANKQNPTTPVVGRVIPGNVVELRRQLETAFLGGEPPAAYQSSMASELKTFVDGGRLHPLTQVWNEIHGDQIFPQGVQRVVKIGGVPYAIPYDFSLISDVFYNKAIFAKLNITPPTTWDQFVTVCNTLRAAGVQPLGDAGGPFWTLYDFYAPLVSTVGIDGYYKIADGELAFDSPEFRKALDLFRKTMVSCYAKNWSGKTWTQTADDVINGTTGMDQMGIWMAGYFNKAGFVAGTQYDVFPAPGMADKVIFQMDAFAVPDGPPANVKAGENFARAAASVAGQSKFAVLKGSLAPNIEVSPSIYAYAGQKFAQQLAAASKANAVLPNLFFLLPTNVGTELGNQLERFALDPSQETENSVVSTLEALRKEAIADKAYTKW